MTTNGLIQQTLKVLLVDILNRHIEPLFKSGTKLTLIARTPGNDDADVIISSDDLDELAALIQRSKTRDVF